MPRWMLGLVCAAALAGCGEPQAAGPSQEIRAALEELRRLVDEPRLPGRDWPAPLERRLSPGAAVRLREVSGLLLPRCEVIDLRKDTHNPADGYTDAEVKARANLSIALEDGDVAGAERAAAALIAAQSARRPR